MLSAGTHRPYPDGASSGSTFAIEVDFDSYGPQERLGAPPSAGERADCWANRHYSARIREEWRRPAADPCATMWDIRPRACTSCAARIDLEDAARAALRFSP
jgi:hypothetical protein